MAANSSKASIIMSFLTHPQLEVLPFESFYASQQAGD
jgi:hypothetical protein